MFCRICHSKHSSSFPLWSVVLFVSLTLSVFVVFFFHHYLLLVQQLMMLLALLLSFLFVCFPNFHVLVVMFCLCLFSSSFTSVSPSPSFVSLRLLLHHHHLIIPFFFRFFCLLFFFFLFSKLFGILFILSAVLRMIAFWVFCNACMDSKIQRFPLSMEQIERVLQGMHGIQKSGNAQEI